MTLNGVGQALGKELRAHPVSFSILITTLLGFLWYADLKYVKSEEFGVYIAQQNENRRDVKQLKMYLLENTIAQYDKQIYELDRLIAKGEATGRDRQRLVEVRSERAKTLRQLELLHQE